MFGQFFRCLRFIFIPLGVFCLPSYGDDQANPDPLEGFNRAMFAFNEQADRFVLKPVAKGYRFVTPDPVEHGVNRVFDNLGEVINAANDLFQGKFSQAANSTGRFLVNSTLGVVGIFDIATEMGLEKKDPEDFGQTLGAWGVNSGPYLVLPLLGSSTLRDAPARVVDSFINPIGYIEDVPTRNTLYGVQIISIRASLLDAEKLISGDKYVFTRDVYLQRRGYLVSDGELDDAFGDSYEDDDYYE